jgi:hypothetical protein
MTARSRKSTVDWSVVEAGGIVPIVDNAARPDVDVMTARAYVHEALDGRTVVRLVPGALGEAEDLAMEFLGFATGARPQPVGTGARRAVGFPAWALVNDPANGRHALAMVKELERLSRLARSKPGAAKEGYDRLADRLERAAPQLLPTFWEQAGRSFVDAENPKQAAVCFALARTAERAHALAIEEDRVADVHLEFALAGALPVKALSQYAQDLAGRLPPGEAYRRYRTVAVMRVAGGLAPAAGLLDELAKLARAAKLKPADEAESVVAELVALPAAAKATPGFWKSASKPLVAACRKDPAVRHRLLALDPDPPGWGADLTEEWISLLEATGASGLLTAVPSTGDGLDAPAWLERLLVRRRRIYQRRRSPSLIALTERMVPRLLADGRAIDPFGSDAYGADLDVVDALIAGGVVVTGDPAGNRPLNVGGWAEDATPGARDLAALGGHAGLRELWQRSVVLAADHLRDKWGPGSARGPSTVDAIATAMAAWLRDQVLLSRDQTLVGLTELVAQVYRRRWAAAAASPAELDSLATAPVAPALARTLRAGIAAELTWPAYEEAMTRFGDPDAVRHHATWPYLTLCDGILAVVLDRDRVVLEHRLRIPKSALRYGPRLALHYVDGELLVGWDRHAYWSNRPDDILDLSGALWRSQTDDPHALPLPGGGVTTGYAPLHAGDRVVPPDERLATDGTTFWRLEVSWKGTERSMRWREYDPATGAAGEFSVPRFFDQTPGEPMPHEGVLLPLGGELVGVRTWTGDDGLRHGSDVDGRFVVFSDRGRRRLRHVVTMPGADESSAVTVGSDTAGAQRGETYAIHEPGTGRMASQVRSGTDVPPVMWWRYLGPRDEAGSRALRVLDTAQAQTLLAGVSPANSDEWAEQATAGVRATLPALAAAALAAGVAGQVVDAVQVVARLAELRSLAEVSAAQPGTGPSLSVSRDALLTAVDGLALGTHHGGRVMGRDLLDVGAEVGSIGAALAGAAAADLDYYAPDYGTVLGAEGALALRMLGPALPDEQRTALRGLLAALARSPFAGQSGTVRVLTLTSPEHASVTLGSVVRAGDHAAVVTGRKSVYQRPHQTEVTVVERDPTATFDPLPYQTLARPDGSRPAAGLVLAAHRQPSGWADGGRMVDLVHRFETDGPPPWRSEAVDRLAELTGMNRGEAALLLAGVPGLSSREVNFLPKATRETLGLSVAQARAARDALARVPTVTLVAILEAGLPADPGELWAHGPDVDGLATAWTSHFGQTRPVDSQLLAEATRFLTSGTGYAGPTGTDVSAVLQHVVAPAGPGRFEARWLQLCSVIIAWLAYRSPIDDPVRTALAGALSRIRAWLADPELSIAVGYQFGEPDVIASSALTWQPNRYQPSLSDRVLTPARLSGPDDPALTLLADVIEARAIAWLLSDGCDVLVGWAPPPGAPSGAYPHDPRVSAPSIVDEVAATTGLATEAAVYYLQLLALPDPTDKAVATWTGWNAKRVKELGDVLVSAGVAVRAKRERAGRSVFVPGGWLALRAPSSPIEAWKASLYGLARDGTLPLSVLVPTKPVASLFTEAWQRVRDGDPPRLEQLGG